MHWCSIMHTDYSWAVWHLKLGKGPPRDACVQGLI